MTDSKETVAILGASSNRSKYGNRAVRGFIAAGFEVFPINPKSEEIEGVKCCPSLNALPCTPDILTIYTPPKVTEKLMDQIARVNAREVYFNPGCENDTVKARASELSINAIFACSIIARAFFTD